MSCLKLRNSCILLGNPCRHLDVYLHWLRGTSLLRLLDNRAPKASDPSPSRRTNLTRNDTDLFVKKGWIEALDLSSVAGRSTIIFATVIAEFLSNEEVEDIREMFNKIDTDNDGIVSIEELKIGLQKFSTQLAESEVQLLIETGPNEVLSFFNSVQLMLMKNLYSEGFYVSLKDFFIPKELQENIQTRDGLDP
ncbi:hypothetical protein LguiA_033147 [Lonicera macranthoides]